MHGHTCRKIGLALLPWAAMAISSPAQTFTTLANFDGANGANPEGMSLVQGLDGNFYGTTAGGGVGYGTVFKITPSGTLTTLHSFDVDDGAVPEAGLLLSTSGTFYGVTCLGGNGYGTVFAVAPDNVFRTLHTFAGTDGGCPAGALIQAPGGAIYGTTYRGGPAGDYGTIFKIMPDGTLTTVHAFGPPDGSGAGPLVLATNGYFYGSAESGGTGSGCGGGCGTVFKMSPDGAFTTIHSFSLNVDGAQPEGGLTQGVDGNLYGTTYSGIGAGGEGTVFEVLPGRTFATLHVFEGFEGAIPISGVIQGTDGNFYGTTVAGGSAQEGVLFKISSSGTLTPLHSFGVHPSDGSNPEGGLVQGTDGKFYGTTYGGGSHGYGSVFRLSAGLGPFVKTLPHFGNVGDEIKILGTNLGGAISVDFDGILAAFRLLSPTAISAVVPQPGQLPA